MLYNLGFLAPAGVGGDAKEPPWTLQEIRKLESYLTTPPVSATPGCGRGFRGSEEKDESAECIWADKFIGVLTVDDDAGERSYDFTMEIPPGISGERNHQSRAPLSVEEIPKTRSYMKNLFGTAGLGLGRRDRKAGFFRGGNQR